MTVAVMVNVSGEPQPCCITVEGEIDTFEMEGGVVSIGPISRTWKVGVAVLGREGVAITLRSCKFPLAVPVTDETQQFPFPDGFCTQNQELSALRPSMYNRRTLCYGVH